MKYLGIDYGTKRIGLAVSDDEGKVAFPKKVIENDGMTLSAIHLLVEEEGVQEIVIGESKDLHMNDNPIMKEIHMFAEQLGEKTGCEIVFHTELFTSAQAATENHFALTPREQKVRGEKKSAGLDAQAATLMLQSFLDTK